MSKKIVPDDHEASIRQLLDAIPEEVINYDNDCVIHIGAHTGEEVPFYFSKGFKEIYLVEANAELAVDLKQKFADDKNIHVFNLAICDKEGEIDFIVHKTKKGSVESASILDLKELGRIVPVFDSSSVMTVPCTTLDSFVKQHNLQNRLGLITLDVQGAELMVLEKGAETLSNLKCIISEVNLIENYKGCGLEADIEKVVDKFNFVKKEGFYHELYEGDKRFPAWGECLWVKTQNS